MDVFGEQGEEPKGIALVEKTVRAMIHSRQGWGGGMRAQVRYYLRSTERGDEATEESGDGEHSSCTKLMLKAFDLFSHQLRVRETGLLIYMGSLRIIDKT